MHCSRVATSGLLQSLPLFYRKRVCLHTPDLDNNPEMQHHVPIYFCLPFTVSSTQHPLTMYTTRLPEQERENGRPNVPIIIGIHDNLTYWEPLVRIKKKLCVCLCEIYMYERERGAEGANVPIIIG